ncbi:MAG: phosphoribosylformimino-5-aminoimidazole carboxamide ribotide isomerase [Verrucomicrobiales bacterium]
MTKFRPCIDLHAGKVKQIVGGSLRDAGPGPKENFVSDQSSASFAEMFRADELTGGHVIQLGPGNREAAFEALAAWPGGLQIGGGVNLENAAEWLEAGASHVIVTSWLFDKGTEFSLERLERLVEEVGRDRIVIDLSCRRDESGWVVATNRWQTLTNLMLDADCFKQLDGLCDEFLIHAADVEGLCGGVDESLVKKLGEWRKRAPITYAGGVARMEDVERVDSLSGGRVDVTVGSALDIFGGTGVDYRELVRWNQRES